jgi:hypothetical protein
MIRPTTNSRVTRAAAERAAGSATTGPLLTLATIAKRMSGTTAIHQANALRSWASLSPHLEMIVFGEPGDAELEQLAREIGATFFAADLGAGGAPRLQPAWTDFRRKAT